MNVKADQKQPVVQKQTQKVSAQDSVQELPESILRQYQEFLEMYKCKMLWQVETELSWRG